MKKVFALLLALAVVFASPLTVLAEEVEGVVGEVTISSTPKKKDNGDGTLTYTYGVTLKVKEDAETTAFEEVPVTFYYNADVYSSVSCGDAGNFTATKETLDATAVTELETKIKNNGNSVFDNGAAITCTYKTSETVTGSSVDIGTFIGTLPKDAKSEDCTVHFMYGGKGTKFVPNTGVSVPYAIITGGFVVAAGLYFATKKKTKLQRI